MDSLRQLHDDDRDDDEVCDQVNAYYYLKIAQGISSAVSGGDLPGLYELIVRRAADVIDALYTSIHACRCIRFYTSATFKKKPAVYSRLLMIHQNTTGRRRL